MQPAPCGAACGRVHHKFIVRVCVGGKKGVGVVSHTGSMFARGEDDPIRDGEETVRKTHS